VSGGKPATETQLHEVLDVVENLAEAVRYQQEALKDLLRVSKRHSVRLAALEDGEGAA
jgi:hypothetical protein